MQSNLALSGGYVVKWDRNALFFLESQTCETGLERSVAKLKKGFGVNQNPLFLLLSLRWHYPDQVIRVYSQITLNHPKKRVAI